MRSVRTLAATLMVLGPFAFAVSLLVAAKTPNGADIFREKCTMCHGIDGKGYPAIKTPDFTDAKWQASVKDSEILNVIKNGKKDTAMPAFADKLSEKEILAVVRQVRAFGRK